MKDKINVRDNLLRILFVDDAYDQYIMIRDLLNASRYMKFEVEWTSKYSDALDKLLHQSYDVCLVDYYLNGQSGLDLIQEVLAKDCKVPLILITGKGDHDMDIEVMQAGAADYLEKSEVRPSTLERSIRYAMERARAINNVRESEERYRDIFENSTDLIQSVDGNGHYLYVNRAWLQTLGYSTDELPNLTMFDVLHPEHIDRCQKYLEQLLNGQESLSIETIFIAKNKRQILVEANLTGKVASDGATIIRGIFRDITERKKAEKALTENEQRLRMVLKSLPVFLFTIDHDGKLLLGEGKMNDIPAFNVSAVYGTHINDILTTVTGKALSQDHQAHITRALAGEDGNFIILVGDRSVEVHYGPLCNEKDEFIGVIGIATNVTNLKQAEDAEHAQRLFAEALYGTAAALNSTLHFDEILDRILMNVGKVIPHELAQIMMLENDFGVIVLSREYEASSSVKSDIRIDISNVRNFRSMIDTRLPVIISDTQQDPHWVDIPEARWMRSYAGIPIQSEGKVIGFLNLGSKTPGFFSTNLSNHVQVFSDQIAVAMQNARYYEQAQELAALNERQRLARDLHDAVSQTLFSASVIAESLPRITKDLPDNIQDGLSELHLLNRRALAEMRSLLLELRPKALVETTLEELLRQLAETFISRQPVDLDLQLIPNLTTLTDVKITLYRIAQEALNNIAKHARASQVSLHLTQTADALQLQVTDNGRGFDVRDTLPENFGLSIMKERARSIGGTLHIISKPEHGTKVSITLPREKSI